MSDATLGESDKPSVVREHAAVNERAESLGLVTDETKAAERVEQDEHD
jgi:hypothetical protein